MSSGGRIYPPTGTFDLSTADHPTGSAAAAFVYNARDVSRKLIPFLLLVALVAGGCKKKPVLPPETIATVGERQITTTDFKHYLQRNAGLDLAQIAPEAASALLDQYVEEVLISGYAERHGNDVSAEQVAEAVRSDPGSTVLEKRDQMRRQRIVADITARASVPSDDDVSNYFRQHASEFSMGERLRARQILVHEEALANEIQQKLNAGIPFEDLSRDHSLAPNAQQGGDIGYISRGQLPKVFEDELFMLQPGQVSRVIRADSTFHIFRVDERRPAGQLDFPAAAPLIRTRIQEDTLSREMSRVVSEAREELKVTILTKRLPFKYSGMFPTAEAE